MTVAERWPAARTVDSVVVDGQLIRIKASAARAKAEHEDVVTAARRTGQPLREMAFRAEAAWADAQRSVPAGSDPAPGGDEDDGGNESA